MKKQSKNNGALSPLNRYHRGYVFNILSIDSIRLCAYSMHSLWNGDAPDDACDGAQHNDRNA